MDTHSFATLIGVGATTVNPYLAFDSLHQRFSKKLFGQFSFDYITATDVIFIEKDLKDESYTSRKG